MDPFIPFSFGVRTSSAPKAKRTFRRSIVIDSGIVKIILYPFTAATNARPIPVFPEVGSIITEPGLSNPRASASSTIESAIRSFILPPGFVFSTFTHISCSDVNNRSNRTCGVFPMVSKILFAFIIILF